MKWMIASDLHGSAFYCKKMLCPKFSRFATRSGTDIQYPVPRMDLQAVCRGHGAWLLQIV